MRRVVLSVFALGLLLPTLAGGQPPQKKPSILIVTVDDMSADSLGAYGCKLAETSPSIDAFARRSLKFNHAHVHVGNCMPGRNIMWSGMFSHVNGVEGFVQNKAADYPVLCDLAKDAGYFTAIRGKVSHSTPYTPYAWDAVLDTTADGKKRHIKDAVSYGDSMRDAITLAAKADKPFCVLINISDPHKPFYAQGKGGETVADPHVPSKVFTGDEVPVPGFLPDDDVIRKELAHYYSSVRRADDCFREIIKALDEAGESPFIMFLSDHGMPLPFAKTQLYHHSTHTPLMVSWPGVTKAGAVDDQHIVGAIDFVPTLLDVMGHQHPTPGKLHGRSFASLLRGEAQQNRDHVILQYNENAGRNRHPMRGIQTREYLYLYNPWSDGQRKFATATTGTMTYRQMVKRAEKETYVAERLQLFDHRVLEELYDIKNDPDCLVNLIDSPEHRSVLLHLRALLTKELTVMGDPVAPLLAAVEDETIRNAYMAAEDERTQNARKKKANQGAKSSPRLRKGALTIQAPATVTVGKPCVVKIQHKLPKSLGKQKLHVTLKKMDPAAQNDNGQRIHREVVTIQGQGETKIEFSVPAATIAKGFSVAAFIGEDFQSNLIHVTSPTIAVGQ
jgi:N-sulfoglucosamine sulfohydrolase